MTSRERILTALSHSEPDRCPTYGWFTGEALKLMEQHLGVQGQNALESALGIDRWRSVALSIERPRSRDLRLSQLIPDEYQDTEGVEINDQGWVTKVHAGRAHFYDYLWQPLQDARDPGEIDEYPFDKPEWIGVRDDTTHIIEGLKGESGVVLGRVNQPFKTACFLRGMENMLCDMLMNEAIVDRIYDHLYGFNTTYAIHLVEAGVDVVQIFGDIAMQDRLMMSPETWRRFDKPRLADLITRVKRVNPEVYVFMHTDGKVIDIIPDLVEIGLDILNPIQPECQDPVDVKRKWGDRLVLHGAVSNQRSVPLGTIQEVKDEVKYLLDHCGAGGGFVLGPANALQAAYPVDNVAAMYEAVAEYYSD